MLKLSQKVESLPSSPSMAISSQAKKMKSEGIDVIDLSIGEPDFNTPEHIIDAAMAAAKAGATKYTVPAGTESLRKAIAQKFKQDNELDYSVAEITTGVGAKQLIFNAFMATLESGDEVVVPTPCWVSYGDIVALHGGVPVYVPCSEAVGFKLTPEALRQSITAKTRWLIINSPGNPTGAVYSRAELEALGEVLKDFPDVLVMSDEIYEHIILTGVLFVSFAQACPYLMDRMLIINGVSKSYAMTGWRIGYAAGPEKLIGGMNKLESQSCTSATSVAQAAAQAALLGDQDCVRQARQTFVDRLETIRRELAIVPELTLSSVPDGAFYLFLGCQSLIGRRTAEGKVLDSDAAVSGFLLNAAKVATVPGAAFGMSPYVRLSFATDPALVVKALKNIRSAIDGLAQG